MLENTDRIEELLLKFLKDELTGAEKKELDEWLMRSEAYRILFRKIRDKDSLRENLHFYHQINEDAGWAGINRQMSVKKKAGGRYKIRWWRYAAIITLLFISGVVIYKITRQKFPVNRQAVTRLPGDRAPGGDRAVLTLGDGSAIELDEAQDGVVAKEGNTRVIKQEDGELTYRSPAGGPGQQSKIVYNTLSTPRGGQYRLILPDGSKVWLNAASSIKYPASFTGKERPVELKGEAYFEISQDISRPFRVTVAGQAEVEVLGTHFNIMAYEEEEDAQVTLLEGSVMVTTEGRTTSNKKQETTLPAGRQENKKLLNPGQQARVKDDKIGVISGVEVEGAVAWKNGYFHFERAGIQTVMRQLARWYDIEVIYEGSPPARQFFGKIQRNLHLSQVLAILEKNEVQFRIEGKKLIVIN